MNKVKFTVNGEPVILSGAEVSPSTSLNDYIRNHLGLFGTKAMCHEGGCGACIVSVTKTHPGTKEKQIMAVNSCLVHILSCHEWDITTVEGVGNRRDGYSEVQTRLASFNGTQCGYCTPGWVMNMHSLFESSKKKLTMMQIERSFAGNICRCTGYRPILDAFKSFATDLDDIKDMEDLHEMKCVKKCTKQKDDDEWCFIENDKGLLFDVNMDNSRWYKAYSVNDVFKILKKEGTDSFRLVAGNTEKGVYQIENEPRVYVDISSISSLQDQFVDENLVLGAGLSLQQTMTIFEKQMRNEDFAYLRDFHKHLELVANVPVKNIGTIGGNLAMKHAHPEFPSDLYVIFETVNATITLMDMKLKSMEMIMATFLQTDLKDKLILNVKIPPLSSNHLIKSYKIMPRAQNAHAIVNAGFHFQISPKNTIISSNIVYGSINPNFNRARDVEKMMKGLQLFSDGTLRKALMMLQEILEPTDCPPEPGPFCKQSIALGLFYKAILSLAPDVNPLYKSGGDTLLRPVSRGTQTYDTDKSVWPLNQPVPKLEALAQCAGEVSYACDVSGGARGVHVAFVLSTICKGDIVKFDAEQALKLSGVVAFFTAKDIPGSNNFTPKDIPWQTDEEEILASKRVSFYGQPIALVAAVTRKLALQAAQMVKITYKRDKAKPVMSVKEALVSPDKEKRIRQDVSIKATDRGTDIYHTIKGTYYIPEQYHFTMETQSCSVSPGGVGGAGGMGGVKVRAATQWMDLVQVAIARTLNLPVNCVEVEVDRVGGAYGGKASRSSQVACACALVAHKLQRHASLVMPLTDNMNAIGKRQACFVEYELGVNEGGEIQYADVSYYCDCGISYSDTSAGDIVSTILLYYDAARWSVTGYSVLTDKASNTWCRAPATTEATAIAEHIIRRISHITQKDPHDIRKLNMDKSHATLMEMVETFKMDTEYEERLNQIKEFNGNNAWKKKALELTVMCFPMTYFGNFPVTVSIYHGDGTVIISHGGIEMGQGINTKVAQVCAYILKIPLDMVKVKGADTFVSPNSMVSSGSVTSECVAFATVKACNELLHRMEEVKKDMDEPTWLDVVKKAFDAGINLQANSTTSDKDKLTSYTVYGACSIEVTLDVLTGEYVLERVDLLEDTGRSLNPDLDVGQIEGAFTMGIGLWTTEHLIYNSSGKLLTDHTWTYKPPGACDVARDFRVNFRRNSVNQYGVLRSKATGEPALVLAVCVTHALRDAVLAARVHYGYDDKEWLHIDAPYTVENIIKAISPNIESYKLK